MKKLYAVTFAAVIADCAGKPSDDRYIQYVQVYGELAALQPVPRG